MRKLLIKTYGCQMNEYDSDKMLDALNATYGFTITYTPEEADFIILNTCSVRKKATEKIYSALGRLRPLKKKNPHLIIAVGGCVSVEEKANIFKRAPQVSIVFGPQNIHELPQLYGAVLKQEQKLLSITPGTLDKFNYLPTKTTSGPSAYISIMEGCNKFCSYCIVPYTRGIEISRPLNDILQEVKLHLDRGVRELHLLGQNVNSYYDKSSQHRLADLIEKIAQLPEVAIIRFTTSHPVDMEDSLINLFGTLRKLASHLHLPIQSGSDRILQLMRRGYTVAYYRKIIQQLRRANPALSISTDLIVGFPGETEEDFQATLQTVKELNFDSSFSFIYSPRPGTPAAQLEDNVPLIQKQARLTLLQNQLAIQAREHSNSMLGHNYQVLITNRSSKKHHHYAGRTLNNKLVHVVSEQALVGKIVEVHIQEALANSLKGELISIQNC